jgi:hypothetical protein
MKKILFLFIAILISITVDAQKWYVATTGNDASGNGTALRPWKTVKHAADTITTANGFTTDTIFIMAGVYNESTNQIIKSPGISLLGEMTASDTTHIILSYTNVSEFQGAIHCASTSGISTDDNSSISYLKITGNNTTSYQAIYIGYRSKIKIHHCVIEDFFSCGIKMNASMTSYPNLYLTGIEIHDNVINNCAGWNVLGGYDPDAGQASIILRGTDGIKIYNNSFDNRERPTGENGETIGLYRNKNHQIYNNTFYRNDHEVTSGGTRRWNFFVEEWNYRGNGQFYNNTLYGLAQFSIGGDDNQIVSGCSYGYKIYNNRFLNTTNGNKFNNGTEVTLFAICVEGGGHNLVEVSRNYIQRYAVGVEISTPTSDPAGYWKESWIMENVKVQYNIIENVGYADNQYGALAIWLINETMVSPYYNTFNNILIANNVLTGNNGGTYRGYTGVYANINGTWTGLDIKNNIITGFSARGIYIYEHSTDGLDLSNSNATYNLMYDNTSSNLVYIESTINQTNVDITTGNLTSDPLFVGTGTPPADYKLQSTSPARDAGISVGLTSDYGGYSVPVGIAPDIGAWEYGADITPPNWTPQGIGWDRMYQKLNFRDSINFTRGFMIAGVPISASGSGLEILGGLTASVDDLNATAGATGNFQGQINSIVASTVDDSKADTSLSNLSSVAINTHLLPDTAGTINLGSGAKPFGKIFGGSTIVSDLSIGDSTSNTIAKFDSVAVFNDKLYAFIAGDTVGWGVLTADSEDITDHVIMLTDTIHTNGKHILYTQWQVDSIFAGFTSGFDSVYIYAKVDSLINVVGEQQSQIDLLWAAIDSLGLGDFNPPSFLSAEVGTFNDSILVVILNDTDVQQDSIPAVGAFTVKENGSAMGIEEIDIGNDTVYISLDALAIEGYTYTVSYNKDFDYPQLQDSSENITPSWTNRTVTNNVFDAFPSIVSVTETLTNSTDRTSHPITMPETVEEGDLLLVFFASDAAGEVTYSIDTDNSDAGWTLESYTATNTVGAIVLWKVADADGDTLTITTSQSQISVAQTYRITNFDPVDPIQAVHYNGVGNQYPDPPAATGDYGADDYLWIVSYGADSYTSYATAAPTDFTGLDVTYIEEGGACSVNTAWRKHNVNGAYDPGTFTANTTNEEWVSNTVIVNPIQ